MILMRLALNQIKALISEHSLVSISIISPVKPKSNNKGKS